MKQLFGTDGIRGAADEYPLDPPTVRRFGGALSEVLAEEYGRPCRLVLGRDTRESGSRLRDAVVRGFAHRGVEAVDAGVITTPGLAHVLASGDFEVGVMISASHNPFHDNGLKAFGRDGTKLSDALERRIEERILDDTTDEPGDDGAAASERPGLVGQYAAHLEGILEPRALAGRRLVLDCANGAACAIAPGIFRHYGADVVSIGDAPDGKNINLDCGSLHLDRLGRAVADGGRELGIAFDGDADRCLAVDRGGRVVDGDHILFLTGRRLHRADRLRGAGVVATIMSNLWLEQRLEAEGISLYRAPVGDKYVLEQMIEHDLALGGEQSGHIIFRDHATTGDGILTGLLLLDALAHEDRALEAILDGIEPYPQVLIAVPVASKPDLLRHPQVGPAVAEIEGALAGSGRVVLRYSGTEPVARVMVEGADAESVHAHAERLAAVIGRELGG